jgi:hypothetical protein
MPSYQQNTRETFHFVLYNYSAPVSRNSFGDGAGISFKNSFCFLKIEIRKLAGSSSSGRQPAWQV